LEGWVQEGLQPDLTLWFDLPARMASQRRAAVRAADRFEAQDDGFFERVRQGYQQRRAVDTGRFEVLDASLSREQVWGQLLAAMEGRGW
jgi:dTMP kinase